MANAFSKLRRAGVEFDKFQPNLNFNLAVLQSGEGQLQVFARVARFPGALLGHPQERFDPPQIRLRLGCRGQVGNSLGKLALKVKQYTEVRLRVHIFGAQTDYLGEHWNC